MKKELFALLLGSILVGEAAGQAPGQPYYPRVPGQANVAPELPEFDLEFPGGTPEDLIKAINDRLPESPVNAIIPEEHRDVKIPSMSLKNVDVQQVFESLRMASQTFVGLPRSELYVRQGSHPADAQIRTQPGFTTSYSFMANPPIKTNTVWYFFVQNPPLTTELDAARFYQLAPYLSEGLDINDITTAIKAGYKMLGENNPPELNFHPETKLLIVVGPPSKLHLIDAALNQLPKAPQAKAETAPKSAQAAQVID